MSGISSYVTFKFEKHAITVMRYMFGSVYFYHQGNSFCKLCTLEERNISLCIQQDQALSQTTLKIKVVCNFHRELMVCKFVRAKILKWLEISNLFQLADLRNDES